MSIELLKQAVCEVRVPLHFFAGRGGNKPINGTKLGEILMERVGFDLEQEADLGHFTCMETHKQVIIDMVADAHRYFKTHVTSVTTRVCQHPGNKPGVLVKHAITLKRSENKLDLIIDITSRTEGA